MKVCESKRPWHQIWKDAPRVTLHKNGRVSFQKRDVGKWYVHRHENGTDWGATLNNGMESPWHNMRISLVYWLAEWGDTAPEATE